MCPHTAIYVSSYYCIRVQAMPYYCICVFVLLYTCPRTTMCVSSYCYICALIPLYTRLVRIRMRAQAYGSGCLLCNRHTTAYELMQCWHSTSTPCAYYYIGVLVLLYVSSYYYACPRTAIYVSSYLCICAQAVLGKAPADYAEWIQVDFYFFLQKISKKKRSVLGKAPADYAEWIQVDFYRYVLILLYMCPHTTNMCPHFAISVLTLLHAFILLCMCPHTTTCVSSEA